MKIIGITGGIGAGKSQLLSYIRKTYPAEVVMADEVAHELMEPGQECYHRICALFRDEIRSADGTIDRKKMANAMFQDEEKRRQVNRIVHPAVKEEIINRISRETEAGRKRYFIIEAALLLEDHYDAICDELWYIDTKEEIRRERLKLSRGYSDEKISDIMRSQKTEEEFRKACNKVIDNNRTLSETFSQIDIFLAG